MVRKQYIDKDGLLIQDRSNRAKEQTKRTLIQGLDLAQPNSNGEEAFDFRAGGGSSSRRQKASIDLRSDIDKKKSERKSKESGRAYPLKL